ncbi:MAG: PAS domain S-box protein [Gemmatimonadales bacterium]
MTDRDPTRDERRRAFVEPLFLAALVIAFLGSTMAYGLGLIGPSRLAVDLVITLLVGGLPLLLVRRDRIDAAVAVSITTTLVAIAWLAWTGGGVSAHWAIYQLLCVTMASFLVGRRWAYLLATLVVAIDAVIVTLGARNLLPPSQVSLQPSYTLLVLAMASYFAVLLITRFVGQVDDVLQRTRSELTYRKLAEAELERTNREYELLVAMVPGIVYQFRVNPDGSYTFPFVSDAIERVAGIKASEAMANAGVLVDAVLPSAREDLLQSIATAVRDRQVWQHEMPIRARDNTVKWVRGHSVPTGVDAEGRTIWHGVLLDITERRRTEEQLRESEERFRSLADSIPEVFWIADYPGGFTYASPAAKAVFGFTAEAVVADSGVWIRSIHPEDRQEVLARFDEWTRSAREPYHVGYRIIRPDGEIRWLESRVTLRQVVSDGRLRVGGVVTDVTERRQAELEARALEYQQSQRQKLEALGTLAGGIAHDFNNLLTVIVGYTELTRLEFPLAKRYLDPMAVAGQRARDLVRRILLFSRPSTEERRPVRLGQAISEAAALLRSTLPKSIDIHWTPPPTDSVILGDPSQINQALVNLGVNAGHAMKNEVGRIELALSVQDLDPDEALRRQIAPGAYAVVTVRDNGVGMAPEVVERIFEPFFTTKPAGQGTGLGLAVVHSIVHNHGGTIAVETVPGRGTVFTCWLPVDTAGSESTPAPSAPVRATEAFGGGREVMVVEDQPEVLRTTCAMLERLGFRPTPFEEPVEAIREFSATGRRFAAVLSDRSMPAMSGLEVGRAVAESHFGTPFILMTGFEGGLTPDTLAAAGVGAVLS